MAKKYAVGIDIGATNIRVALGDSKGNIISKISEKIVVGKKPSIITDKIIEIVNQFFSKNLDIAGIGIGSIGPLDLKRGCLIKPANLPYKKIPIVKPIKEKFKVPTYILNDCDAAVIGEKMFGAGKNVENLVYITFSTGIGAGIFVGNHLLLGKDGNATEVGHTVIDFTGKLKCGCGKRGHWEAYCSGKNMPNFVRMLMKGKNSLLMKLADGNFRNITSEMLFKAAEMKDKIALEIVDKIGKINAIGIANVINNFDPSLITIGGAVALKNKELFLTPIKKYVKNYTINRIPKIILTPLGEDIVLYGAIAMVFYHSDEAYKGIFL